MYFFVQYVSLRVVSAHVWYSLLGWVDIFRSGFEEHSDLFALGDVHWKLNEGLQAQRQQKS